MELEILKSSLSDPTKLIDSIIAAKDSIDTDKTKLYDIKNHDVMNEALRPKKKVKHKINEDDKEVEVISYKDVNRVPIPYQKLIVQMRAFFLCGNAIELNASPKNEIEEKLLEVLQKTWDDNKLDYENSELAIKQMADTEVAEIWYTEEADADYWADTPNAGKKQKLRVKIIESNGGEELFPVYDKYGDMISFLRTFDIKDEDGKEIKHAEIYTAETNYFFEKTGQVWEQKTTSTNANKKIPFIYFHQPTVEWDDVQPAIGRKEDLISNHGDTNNYFSSPMVALWGEVKSMPDKDDRAKVIQLEGEKADVKYMTWDQSPESLKLEYEKIEDTIFMHSGTPNISKDRANSVGAQSGVALELQFMVPRMFAKNKIATFGKSIQRRINLLKSLLCEMNQSLKPALGMSIKPKFNIYLPNNRVEDLDVIIKSKEAGIMSVETAVEQNPLIEDGGVELDKIKAEKESATPDPLKNNPDNPIDDKLKVA